MVEICLQHLAVSLVIYLLVNVCGMLMEGSGYRSSFLLMSGREKTFNIIYRILAPITFWCFIYIISFFAGLPLTTFNAWLSVLFYWLIRSFASIAITKNRQIDFVSILAQALIGTLLAFYFSKTIVENDVSLLIPGTSDVVFQLWLLVAIAIVAFLASRNPSAFDFEKQFFSIQRIAEPYLPRRFNEDLVLQILFYTFAMAEDHYRPSSVRRIERITAHLGLAKTTGIMQVKSKKALSDEESIELAIPIIEGIWDEFLEKCSDLHRKNLEINESSYSYKLQPTLQCTRDHLKTLHSRYMGTTKFPTGRFYSEPQRYVLTLNYISPDDRLITVNATIESSSS